MFSDYKNKIKAFVGLNFEQLRNTKARAIVDDNGCVIGVISNETIVGTKDDQGNWHRHWDGRSTTTSRHIKEITGISSKDWYKLPYEEL